MLCFLWSLTSYVSVSGLILVVSSWPEFLCQLFVVIWVGLCTVNYIVTSWQLLEIYITTQTDKSVSQIFHCWATSSWLQRCLFHVQLKLTTVDNITKHVELLIKCQSLPFYIILSYGLSGKFCCKKDHL